MMTDPIAPPPADPVELALVDFDDTLVDTAPRFQRARRALFARLARAGFDEDLVRRVHHDEVDAEMLGRFGLGPFRLEPSFRETYLRLCARAGLGPDLALADECAALGREVAGTPPCLDGAIEALGELARSVPTILYTQAGDPAYQLGCIREAGVLDVLRPEQVRICARKTPEEFRTTLDHYGVADPTAAWMIGNSMRADINPALVVGARAILVEVADPWEFDLVEPVSHEFVRVRSFPEAVGFLLARAA